jgi:hypothetical protein
MADEKKKRRVQKTDPEILAMTKVGRILGDLEEQDDRAVWRVLDWARNKFLLQEKLFPKTELGPIRTDTPNFYPEERTQS